MVRQKCYMLIQLVGSYNSHLWITIMIQIEWVHGIGLSLMCLMVDWWEYLVPFYSQSVCIKSNSQKRHQIYPCSAPLFSLLIPTTNHHRIEFLKRYRRPQWSWETSRCEAEQYKQMNERDKNSSCIMDIYIIHSNFYGTFSLTLSLTHKAHMAISRRSEEC